MRPHATASTLPAPAPAPAPGLASAQGPAAPRSDWGTLAKLLPYLWRYRWRVGIALGFLVLAKVAMAPPARAA